MACCETCNNPLTSIPVKKLVYMGMGKYRNKTVWKEVCSYCNWKGVTGYGLKLRTAIKEHNDKLTT